MTRISQIFTDSIRVNPCNPCLKERWTETGWQNKVAVDSLMRDDFKEKIGENYDWPLDDKKRIRQEDVIKH
jgi:hypothetical protein